MTTPQKQLPNGWQWAKLGDVCEIIIGKTPSRNNPRAWGGKHQWAKISDLDGIVVNTSETLSDEGAKICQGRLLEKGTLMYSFKLTIGKTAFAGVDLYTNEAIAGLIPKSNDLITPAFLYHALSVADPLEHTGYAVKGRTLNKKTLPLITIPLPPLAEQQRIVSELQKVERAKNAVEDMLELIKALNVALMGKWLPL